MDPRGPGFRPDGSGPGDGFFNQTGDPGLSSPSSGGSSNLPVWALVLIMLASALVTLILLWLFVLFIHRNRRARRAAVRDLEARTAWTAERDTGQLNPSAFGAKDVDLSDAKRCEAGNVELTFVVMAGEDKPSFLARPVANFPSSEALPSSSPPIIDDAGAAVSKDPQRTPPSPS